MSRWYVYKDSENGEWQWAQWVAIPIHETWREKPQGRRFPQWHMALDYANNMARTTPPKTTIKDPNGAVCDLTATVSYRNSIYLKAGDDSFSLARHEWEPLARFLLAAARYQEEE